MTWEERMAERARQRREEREAAEIDHARQEFERAYAAGEVGPLYWSAEEVWAAVTGPVCRECFQAGPYPSGQEHFGWALWLVCNDGCDHKHHNDVLWRAAS